MPDGIIPESEPVWVTFDDKIFMPAILNNSYQIDGSEFFFEIFSYLKLFQNIEKNFLEIEKACKKMDLILNYYGVKFSKKTCGNLTIIKRKLKSLNEVLNLENDFVFNCTGAFSNKLFPDKNLIPLKGSMIYLKNNNHMKNYFAIRTFDNNKFSIIRTANHIAIGVTTCNNPIDYKKDKVIIDRLFKSVCSFFKPKF